MMIMPWCGGSTAFSGMICGYAPSGTTTCRVSSRVPKQLATLTLAWVPALGGGGKTLAVLLGQGGIH
jgi:hypothetical protein